MQNFINKFKLCDKIMIKLDLIDRKILNRLDLNCRQSDAEIGKKTRVSKQVVNYRIKRLLERGIITAFFPHINIAKMGYATHKIYIQYSSISREKEEEVWNYLVNQPNVVWLISCSGAWNLILGIVSKSIEEFDKILTDFMDKYSNYIAHRGITVFNKATLHHRKWLIQKQEPEYWLLGGKIEENKIDDTDEEILKILDKNARMPIIEIAQQLKESSGTIIYRIKQLRKKGIIGAFRIGLNREKLCIHYCKSFVYYQNKTSQKENQLLQYCYQLKNILGVSQSIGSWDLELEFEAESYDEFHKIMKEMKNKFPLIKNFDTVYIEREHGLSFLPEL